MQAAWGCCSEMLHILGRLPHALFCIAFIFFVPVLPLYLLLDGAAGRGCAGQAPGKPADSTACATWPIDPQHRQGLLTALAPCPLPV